MAAQRLLFSGATMKDDTASLETFGVHKGAKVLLMGTRPEKKELAQTSTGDPEEYALVLRISTTVTTTQEKLMPKINAYEEAATRANGAGKEGEGEAVTARKRLQDTHNLLSELLLQSLFSLDGIECPAGFEEARRRRKEAVKTIQGWQDRVDKITSTWKSKEA